MNAHHKPILKSTSQIDSITYFTSGSTPIRTKLPSSITKQSTANFGTECRLTRSIAKLPFGWQVDAVLPLTGSNKDKNSLPIELIAIVNRELGQFYHVQSMNLADLLEVSFLSDYVRTGSLIALSVGENESDVVCIDGRGRMVLSVSKDTYELLGIPGRPSAFNPTQRYIIEIVLNDPAFKAGKGGFERIKTCLRNWPTETSLFPELNNPSSASSSHPAKTFEMLFAFRNSDDKPSTISFSTSISSTCHFPTFSQSTFNPSYKIPSISFNPPENISKRFKRSLKPNGQNSLNVSIPDNLDLDSETWFEDLNIAREWVGKILLGFNRSEIDDRDLEEREGKEEEDREEEQVWKGSWNGFFHPKNLGTSIMNEYELESRQNSFLSLSIHPPPFSPLSHLAIKKTPATRKRPNGQRKKAGRGQGVEEEGNIDGFSTQEGGIDLFLGWGKREIMFTTDKVAGVEKAVQMEECVDWLCWAGQH